MFSHAGDTDLAQASAIRPELADVKPAPVSEQAEAALDRAGVARPQGAGEQLYSGAVSALPGAALGGAAGALTRLGTGAASGAASTGAGILAHAAGASPAQQAAIELGTGLAVPGGLAAGVKAADARALALVPQGRAVPTASMLQGIAAHRGGTLNAGTWAQSAASYSQDGATALSGMAEALHQNAIVSSAQRRVIVKAIGQASSPQARLSTAPGSAYGQVADMANVPEPIRATLLSGLDHLDAAASLDTTAGKGPLSRLGAHVGMGIPFIGHSTGLGLLEAPVGYKAGGYVGALADRALGFTAPQPERLQKAAQRVLKSTSQPLPENPFTQANAITAGLGDDDPQALFAASEGMYGSPMKVPQGITSGLPQDAANAILSGQHTDGYTARYVARMVHHMRTGAGRPEDYDTTAREAIGRAMDTAAQPYNGPSNMGRPIDNYHRWAGAARSYQSAADGAAQAASAAGHHEIAARLQGLKVTPQTQGKLDLYQELLAKHPEAASFVPSQLLKGIE